MPPGRTPRAGTRVAPGRVTARGVTTRTRLPKASSSGSGGPGSGVRQVMPRRRPVAADASAEANADRGADDTRDPAVEPDFSPASIDSLRRVLDGLRRLS